MKTLKPNSKSETRNPKRLHVLSFVIRHSSFGFVALVISVFGFQVSAFSQTYSIDWFTIAGGGGTSTGDVFSVSGTIGQPDAGGPMTNGNFTLTGGFWSLLAVNTPGAPLLWISYTSTNTAVVSWPSPSTGFNLQQNTDLITATWSSPAELVNDNGTDKFIIVNPPTGNRFYRLIKPPGP